MFAVTPSVDLMQRPIAINMASASSSEHSFVKVAQDECVRFFLAENSVDRGVTMSFERDGAPPTLILIHATVGKSQEALNRVGLFRAGGDPNA
jgi:hypothetical protein